MAIWWSFFLIIQKSLGTHTKTKLETSSETLHLLVVGNPMGQIKSLLKLYLSVPLVDYYSINTLHANSICFSPQEGKRRKYLDEIRFLLPFLSLFFVLLASGGWGNYFQHLINLLMLQNEPRYECGHVQL